MLEVFKKEKGTIHKAAVEAVRSYAVLSYKFPGDPEAETARKMWDSWMCVNNKHEFDAERDIKFARLSDILKQRESYSGKEDVIDIYFDILYIETGVSIRSRHCKRALDAFFEVLKQNGLKLPGGSKRDYLKKIARLRKSEKTAESSSRKEKEKRHGS